MRVVLDTSVLIAALRSSTGAAAENLRLVLLKELTILMDYKLSWIYFPCLILHMSSLTASDSVVNFFKFVGIGFFRRSCAKKTKL